jgi:Phospholipase_D-nuclease N-terminal
MKSYNLQGKKWQDLSAPQKSAVVMLGVVQFTLLIAALADIRKRSPEEINGDKRLWTVVAFINYIGPISYFLFGRKPAQLGSGQTNPES